MRPKKVTERLLLPLKTSAEIFYHSSLRAVGLLPLLDQVNVSSVVQAFRLIMYLDPVDRVVVGQVYYEIVRGLVIIFG